MPKSSLLSAISLDPIFSSNALVGSITPFREVSFSRQEISIAASPGVLSGAVAMAVPSTAPYYVKSLDSGHVWTNSGAGVSISYTFWSSLPGAYAYSTEANGFQPFTVAQKAAAVKILGMLENIANVTFVEVPNGSGAQLGFAQANLGSGVGAWAYYPNTGAKSGDVWTNTYYASSTQNVAEGTYGSLLLIHEIGHAMGLKHDFEAPNVLTGAEDSSRYTVMSYNWPLYPISYMLYDVAALQAKYGANMNYATGDDNYVLKSGYAYTIWDAGGADTLDGSALTSAMTLNLNAGTLSSVGKTQNIAIAFNVTIENVKGGAGADIIYGNAANNRIEGNGGNDTIYGSAGNDILDGGAGTDSVVYTYSISDFLIRLTDSVTVTLTNALLGFDTLINIEKFVFGSLSYDYTGLQNYIMTYPGTDPGTGTDPVTTTPGITLSGTSGSDTLTGGAGDDIIHGNGGYDNLRGGAGDDQIFGASYIDRIYGDDGNDTLYGYGNADILSGGAGNDTLYGGDGNDKLYGDDGNDTLYAESGNDYLYGGAGNDTMDGGSGADRLYGDAGNDKLSGGDGNDVLYGQDGNDILSGGDGNDYLYGGNGNDVLFAGLGQDVLYGQTGSDTFAFEALDSSKDYIKDFTLTGPDADKLNITDVLSGFDGSKDIHDFVQINVSGTSQMTLMINQDGSGNDWITAAAITGSNFKGVTLDSLVAGGQIITNELLL